MIRVGTASWTDPTLTRDADWYPSKSMSAEARLRYYASVFPLVEVDATYYHPPTQHLAGLWADRTPPDFRFDIKAYSLLTQHPTRPDSLWPELEDAVPEERRGDKSVYLSHFSDEAIDRAFALFNDALLPLQSAGKLGAVFFQFPQWFTARRENREYLEALAGRLPEYTVAVEFRHASWLDERTRDRTMKLLADAGLAYVCVDEPQGFASSVPPHLEATSDLAVVRFHGHNTENWQRKGITAAERFKYLYSDDELRDWKPKVRRLAENAAVTHVLFNNCYGDYGVRNARQLGELLGEGVQPGAPPPAT